MPPFLKYNGTRLHLFCSKHQYLKKLNINVTFRNHCQRNRSALCCIVEEKKKKKKTVPVSASRWEVYSGHRHNTAPHCGLTPLEGRDSEYMRDLDRIRLSLALLCMTTVNVTQSAMQKNNTKQNKKHLQPQTQHAHPLNITTTV